MRAKSAVYASEECDVCERRVRCMRAKSAMYASDERDKTTGAIYANNSAMYANDRNHDEDSEVDGQR